MSIRVKCPTCGDNVQADDDSAGRRVFCQTCGTTLVLPAAKSRDQLPDRPSNQRGEQYDDERDFRDCDEYDDGGDAPPRTKYCHECGKRIRFRAEICPSCGARQPDQFQGRNRAAGSRDGIKVPVLISAISNIVVGLIWACTCLGIVFTIPMLLLCIFKFTLWSRADNMPLRTLGSKAKTLAIFEIVVGLVNWIALVCGILAMINGGKLAFPKDDYD